MPRIRDLAGMKFGLLTVIRQSGRAAKREVIWRCRCACGGKTDVVGTSLTRGATKSCGCAMPAMVQTARTTHGDTKRGDTSPEFRVWQGMIARCENQKHRSFKRYGGRGISVCARWRNSYEAFLVDMGRRPTPQHQIDRVDNEKGYEPGNCRWATASEQARNRSSSRQIKVGGRSQTLVAWAEEAGLSRSTIASRIERGWAPERAVSRGGAGARNTP